jgi:peptidoglycan/xylan/chitin deacetylase (PgdA/CDA1 family)
MPTTEDRPPTATIVSHGNASRRMVALTFDVGYTAANS